MTVDYFPKIHRAIVGGFNNPFAKVAFFITPRAAWDTLLGWMATQAVVDEQGNEIRSFGAGVYLGRLRDDIGYYKNKEDEPPRQKHYFSLTTGENLDATKIEASVGLHLFHQNDRTGLETIDGEVLIPAVYDRLIPLNTQLFIANKAHTWDNGYGLVNRHNEVVIPFKYDFMDPAGPNRLLVTKNGLHGQINWQGETVIDLIYDSSFYFGPNGLATVSKNDQEGAINRSGEVVVPVRYDDIYKIRSKKTSGKTYFRVRMDGKEGLLSSSGKVLIPPKYGDIELHDSFARGWVVVENPTGTNTGLINIRTGVTLPAPYNGFTFRDHFLVAWRSDSESNTNERYKLFTLSGKPLPGKTYQAMEHEYDYFIAARNGSYGVLSSHADVLIPFVYKSIVAYGPNLVRALKHNGRQVYINTNGRIYRPRP